MNLSYKKIVASALVTTMTLALTLSPIASSADETVIELSRDEVGQMAVDQSTMVRDLEAQQRALAMQFSDLNTAMDGMQVLYDLLPAYQGLYASYQAIENVPNYVTYLQLASDPTSVDKASRMIDEVDTDEVAPEPAESMSIAEEGNLKTALAVPGAMDVATYGQYVQFKAQFALAGVTNPNLSKAEEYETFAYPINSGPLGLQNGVISMGIGIKSAEAGVSGGAVSLYDTLLMMEGYLALQEGSYQMALADYNSAKERFKKGQISEVDYISSRNKEEIARRGRNSMQRDVDNLIMSFNMMLGLDITAEIELETVIEDVIALEAKEFYIERGLKERNEIETFEINYSQALSEFELIDDYFSSSSDKYKAAALELEALKLDEQAMLMDIEQNIRKAYMNVLEKEENFQVKKVSMEDANRQLNELKLNVSLGFLTESVLNGLNIMVTQATNDYYTAYRDYVTAVKALEDASGFGPAYTSGGSALMLGM